MLSCTRVSEKKFTLERGPVLRCQFQLPKDRGTYREDCQCLAAVNVCPVQSPVQQEDSSNALWEF